jgi:hypothetical protein
VVDLVVPKNLITSTVDKSKIDELDRSSQIAENVQHFDSCEEMFRSSQHMTTMIWTNGISEQSLRNTKIMSSSVVEKEWITVDYDRSKRYKINNLVERKNKLPKSSVKTKDVPQCNTFSKEVKKQYQCPEPGCAVLNSESPGLKRTSLFYSGSNCGNNTIFIIIRVSLLFFY